VELKSRLDELVSSGLIRVRPTGPNDAPHRPARSLEEVIPGRLVTTAHGQAFLVEERCPARAAHGGVTLTDARSIDGRHLAVMAVDEALTAIDPSRAVFLDSETTGLGLGAGTYVFLVGLGFFEGDEFVIRQYFLRDLDEEPAFLAALRSELERFQAAITFNGKAFDFPLLENRFIMARQKPCLPIDRHLDLRHAAARLWRERLTGCRLADLETGILGFARDGDVPGELIPLLYFDYLRNGDGRIVEPVFAHNRNDVLSLIALTVKAAALVADPLGDAASDPADRFSLARLLERLGRLEDSLACYELVMAAGPPTPTFERAARHLARLYKRVGRVEKAVEIWRHLIDAPGWTVHPHIELAKYYEHRSHDYDRAIAVVRAAMGRLAARGRTGPRGSGSFYDDRGSTGLDPESRDLRRRLERLERKKARRA